MRLRKTFLHPRLCRTYEFSSVRQSVRPFVTPLSQVWSIKFFSDILHEFRKSGGDHFLRSIFIMPKLDPKQVYLLDTSDFIPDERGIKK